MTLPCAALAKLEAHITQSNSLLCVGLDPEMSRIPDHFRRHAYPLFAFCRRVIDATADSACAFKPNTAFFEAYGSKGWDELHMVFDHLQEYHPEHFTICDAKRGDIGSTNRGYVTSIYDSLGADAVTLHPYLGAEALAPFLDRAEKAAIILCRTSNPGAREIQDLEIQGKALWRHTAERVTQQWNIRKNCMLVVGATWPNEMAEVRKVAPEMTFLVPGIGAQGGDIAATVQAGLRGDGKGLVLSSSRAILYGEALAKVARETRDTINHFREQVYAGR